MLHDEIGLCTRNNDTVLVSPVSTIDSDRLKSKRTLTLHTYDFCISTPILKLEMTMSVI